MEKGTRRTCPTPNVLQLVGTQQPSEPAGALLWTQGVQISSHPAPTAFSLPPQLQKLQHRRTCKAEGDFSHAQGRQEGDVQGGTDMAKKERGRQMDRQHPLAGEGEELQKAGCSEQGVRITRGSQPHRTSSAPSLPLVLIGLTWLGGGKAGLPIGWA